MRPKVMRALPDTQAQRGPDARYFLRIRRPFEPVEVIAYRSHGLAIIRAHVAFLKGMLLDIRVSARLIDVRGQRLVHAVAFTPKGLPDGRYCRFCGCSHDDACEDGCFWAGPDVCSVCAVWDGADHLFIDGHKGNHKKDNQKGGEA